MSHPQHRVEMVTSQRVQDEALSSSLSSSRHRNVSEARPLSSMAAGDGRTSEETSGSSSNTPIPDEATEATGVPLTMAASVVLNQLPKDATAALRDVGRLGAPAKVAVHLQPIGSAPRLKNKVFRVSSNQKFETIVRFLRKRLDVKENDALFCYVNNLFAPGLDEEISGLWSCFKSDDMLMVSYSMSPAFG